MRKEGHSAKSIAVRLPQPGNLLSDKAHWFVRIEYGLARVERWLKPVDRIDDLIRRSIFPHI